MDAIRGSSRAVGLIETATVELITSSMKANSSSSDSYLRRLHEAKRGASHAEQRRRDTDRRTRVAGAEPRADGAGVERPFTESAQQRRFAEAEQRTRFNEAEQRTRFTEAEQRTRFNEAEQRTRFTEAEQRTRFNEAEQRTRFAEAEQRPKLGEAEQRTRFTEAEERTRFTEAELVAEFSRAERCLNRACDQMALLQRRLCTLRMRRQRAAMPGVQSSVSMQLSVTEGVYRMYHEYGRRKSRLMMRLLQALRCYGDKA